MPVPGMLPLANDDIDRAVRPDDGIGALVLSHARRRPPSVQIAAFEPLISIRVDHVAPPSVDWLK